MFKCSVHVQLMRALQLDIWEHVASFCTAAEWARGAGMSCRALAAMQSQHLQIGPTRGSLVVNLLQWLAEHCSRAEVVDVCLRRRVGGVEMPWTREATALIAQQVLHACAVGNEDLIHLQEFVLSAASPCQAGSSSIPWESYLGALLARTPRLRLLSYDVPFNGLPPLSRMEHLSMCVAAENEAFRLDVGCAAPSLKTMRIGAPMRGAAWSAGVQTVQIPSIDLSGLGSLRWLCLANVTAEAVTVPPGCQVSLRRGAFEALKGLHDVAGQTKRAIFMQAVAGGFVDNFDTAEFLRCLPYVEQLALYFSGCMQHPQCQTFRALHSSFPPCCQLESLDLTHMGCSGHMEVHLPSWVPLRYLRLCARELRVVLEDPGTTAACLSGLAVIYHCMHGPGPFVMLEPLASRGLTLHSAQRGKETCVHLASLQVTRRDEEVGFVQACAEISHGRVCDMREGLVKSGCLEADCAEWNHCGACCFCVRSESLAV